MNRSALRVVQVGAVLAVLTGLLTTAPAANAMILPPHPGFVSASHSGACAGTTTRHAQRMLPQHAHLGRVPTKACS